MSKRSEHLHTTGSLNGQLATQLSESNLHRKQTSQAAFKNIRGLNDSEVSIVSLRSVRLQNFTSLINNPHVSF